MYTCVSNPILICIIYFRDALAHSMRRNIETHRLDVLRNITDLLGRTFSSQFVFPVLGHEDGQGNDFRRLGELWRHWLPSEALHTFEKGEFFVLFCLVFESSQSTLDRKIHLKLET